MMNEKDFSINAICDDNSHDNVSNGIIVKIREEKISLSLKDERVILDWLLSRENTRKVIYG